MKKILGSLLAITSLIGANSFANTGHTSLDLNVKDSLNNITFSNDEIRSDSYLISDKKLVVIVEYSNEKGIESLLKGDTEPSIDIHNKMESIVLKGLCESPKIATLINSPDFQVEVEYLLSNGIRYMTRDFNSCK